MQYLVLSAALARAKERSGAASADDAYLTELLQLSAGRDPDNVVHYRPFLVGARWLEQNRAQQALSEADGAKFTGLLLPISSLLQLQAAYDKANNLTIPDGFEALSSEVTEQRQLRPFRIGSSSHTPKVNP